jgi:hypothetical protein
MYPRDQTMRWPWQASRFEHEHRRCYEHEHDGFNARTMPYLLEFTEADLDRPLVQHMIKSMAPKTGRMAVVLLDALIMDADLIEAVEEAKGRARRIAMQLVARLRHHVGDPKFVELGQRLEKLKERQEGLDDSRKFLKEILKLARDVVQAEKETPPEVVQDQGIAALTELFEEIRNDKTPIVVEKIVADIDDIVRIVRFDGWQGSSPNVGERLEAIEC